MNMAHGRETTTAVPLRRRLAALAALVALGGVIVFVVGFLFKTAAAW